MSRIVTVKLRDIIVAFALLTATFVIGLALTTHVQTKLCSRVDRVDASIVKALERSAKGLPSNAYYKEHPDELARQLADISDSISDFQSDAC